MAEQGRGKLKIFMGYAAGVGKTYQMLEEGQELKPQGVDVVVGYFEPHGRKDTIAKTEGLEVIPRKRDRISRQSIFEEMDTDAILAQAAQGLRRRRVSAHQRSRLGADQSVGRMCRCCSMPASMF